MHLSAVFNEYGLDIEQTKIVRHPLNKQDIRDIYKLGMIEAYQSKQSKPVFDNCKYIVSFIGTSGNEARFVGVYEILERLEGDIIKSKMPEGYPYPEQFDEGYYYVMKKTEIMNDLRMRLCVDWVNAVSWAQWARNDKKIISIAPEEQKEFPGYEEVILSYADLFEVIYGGEEFQKWRDALSNVNGIYLICDIGCNKQYIGSTYNQEGILGRWKNYVDTHHGGDKELIAHLEKYPNAYNNFQFTIMRILPKCVTDKEATVIESLYKRKLNTRYSEYGMNLN